MKRYQRTVSGRFYIDPLIAVVVLALIANLIGVTHIASAQQDAKGTIQSIKGRKKSPTPPLPRSRPQPNKRSAVVRTPIKRTPSPTIPRIVVQSNGGPFALRAALAKAKAGSQIVIGPGRYLESLVIEKQVEITAANPDSGAKVIIESTGESCVFVKSGRVVLRGLSFECHSAQPKGAAQPAKDASPVAAIHVSGGSLTMIQCDVAGAAFGVVASGTGATVTFQECNIRDTDRVGVHCSESASVSLSACRIQSNLGEGLRLQSGATAKLRRCFIQHCRSNGARIAGPSSAMFDNCETSENGLSGIKVEPAGGTNAISQRRGMVSVTGGRISGNRGIGIAFANGFDANIEGCAVSGNGEADLEIGSGAAPVIRNCHVGGDEQSNGRAKYGIHVLTGGKGNAENCNIEKHTEFGVLGEKWDGFTLRNCRVHDCRGIGIGASGGRGTIERCEVFDNHIGGIDLTDQGETAILHSQVHDNPRVSDRTGDLFASAPAYHDITSRSDKGFNGSYSGLWIAFWGIRISDGASGTVDDVDVFANGGVGMIVINGATPSVRNTRIYNQIQHGVNVIHADGNYENLESHGNGNCGFLVQLGANPTCVGCDFHDNGGKAVAVEFKALGAFKDCKMRGGGTAAMFIASGSGPSLITCQISEGYRGITIDGSSGGTLDYCDVIKNKNNGLEIKGGSDPKIRNCRILENGWDGVWVEQGSKGHIEDTEVGGKGASGITIWSSSKPTVVRCKITGNKGDGIIVSDGCDPYIRSTTVANSAKEGVSVSAKGLGRFEDCDILQNGIRPVTVVQGGQPSFLNCRIK